MKLVIIYGPPASGKLTIAREICNETGYKLFDNHKIIDLLNSIIVEERPKYSSGKFKRFWTFARKLRIEILKEACIHKVNGIVMTIAYTGESDFIDNIIKEVEKKGGEVYLIKLNSDYKDLEKRVYDNSRKNFGKIQDKEGLKGYFEKYSLDLVYKGRKSLIVNTSKLSVKQSARKIIAYLERK